MSEFSPDFGNTEYDAADEQQSLTEQTDTLEAELGASNTTEELQPFASLAEVWEEQKDALASLGSDLLAKIGNPLLRQENFEERVAAESASEPDYREAAPLELASSFKKPGELDPKYREAAPIELASGFSKPEKLDPKYLDAAPIELASSFKKPGELDPKYREAAPIELASSFQKPDETPTIQLASASEAVPKELDPKYRKAAPIELASSFSKPGETPVVQLASASETVPADATQEKGTVELAQLDAGQEGSDTFAAGSLDDEEGTPSS